MIHFPYNCNSLVLHVGRCVHMADVLREYGGVQWEPPGWEPGLSPDIHYGSVVLQTLPSESFIQACQRLHTLDGTPTLLRGSLCSPGTPPCNHLQTASQGTTNLLTEDVSIGGTINFIERLRLFSCCAPMCLKSKTRLISSPHDFCWCVWFVDLRPVMGRIRSRRWWNCRRECRPVDSCGALVLVEV